MSIQDHVMEKINQGRVAMRPRWQFVLKSVLAVSASILLLLALLYVASFAVFVMRQNGAWFAPQFGWRGVAVLLTHLPWVLVGIGFVVIVALELLVKHYSFAYRRPLLYSVLGIVFIAACGGLAVAQTSLHRTFFTRAHEGRLPIAGPWYRGFGTERFRDVHPGRIESVTEDGVTIRTRLNELLSVEVTSETRLPFGFNFEAGDMVVVVGDRHDDRVEAQGVIEVREGGMMMPGMMQPPPFQKGLRPHWGVTR